MNSVVKSALVIIDSKACSSRTEMRVIIRTEEEVENAILF